MGIRSRIFFIILSCLFIGISLAFIVAERDLSEGLQEQIENELFKQAKIIRQSFSLSDQRQNFANLKPLIDSYSEASGSRITLIAKNGKVLADSSITTDKLIALEMIQTPPSKNVKTNTNFLNFGLPLGLSLRNPASGACGAAFARDSSSVG